MVGSNTVLFGCFVIGACKHGSRSKSGQILHLFHALLPQRAPRRSAFSDMTDTPLPRGIANVGAPSIGSAGEQHHHLRSVLKQATGSAPQYNQTGA